MFFFHVFNRVRLTHEDANYDVREHVPLRNFENTHPPHHRLAWPVRCGELGGYLGPLLGAGALHRGGGTLTVAGIVFSLPTN